MCLGAWFHFISFLCFRYGLLFLLIIYLLILCRNIPDNILLLIGEGQGKKDAVVNVSL
jgi:hypothetical protein